MAIDFYQQEAKGHYVTAYFLHRLRRQSVVFLDNKR